MCSKHGRTLRKDTAAHEIHRDAKVYVTVSQSGENFSNSTIKLHTPLSLKLCKISKNELKVCWYYRTLVQHEKAATFLDILKSFFSSDTRQSMKRRITTKRLFTIYIARCGYTWLDESKWPQEWPISPITIIT